MVRGGQSTENGILETKGKGQHHPALQGWLEEGVHKLWAGIPPGVTGRKQPAVPVVWPNLRSVAMPGGDSGW